MIGRPHSLLRHYKEFTPVCMDYANVVAASLAQDTQRTWWRKLKPSEVSIDLGKIVGTIAKTVGLDAPELKAKWNLDLQNRVTSESVLTQAKKEEMFSTALIIQANRINKCYLHNVNHRQSPSSDEQLLLRCYDRHALPLSQATLQHGDLVVIDTMVVIEQDEVYAADYPSFIAKTADIRILVRADASVRTLLDNHPAFKLKWNPYCRLLARYVSLGESQPVLELILLSARSFALLDRSAALETVKEVEDFTSQYLQELDRSRIAMSLQVGIEARAADGIDFADAAALVQRERYQMFHLDYDHEKLEKIKKFEDDIFEGPFAFWLGLYYFLRSSGEGANSISAGEVVHGLSFYTRYFQDNKWRASLPYLKMLDIIRFDGDALDAVFTLDVRP